MHSSLRLQGSRSRRLGAPAVMLALSLLWSGSAAAGSDPQRFGVGHSMRIEQGERVDTIVTVDGDLTVLGEVEHDAIVVGGTLELGPTARVGGDAIALGGTVVAANGAVIEGDRVVLDSETEVSPLAASVATFVQVLASFLVSALILAFAPRRVRSVATLMHERPGRATLFGLAIVLLFVPLLGVLTISIVGIPLIPVAIILLAAVLVFGMAALAVSLGYAMPFYSERRSAMGALAIGYLLLALVGLIPWLGISLLWLAGLFAGGAVLASWFGGARVHYEGPETRTHEW